MPDAVGTFAKQQDPGQKPCLWGTMYMRHPEYPQVVGMADVREQGKEIQD